MKKVLLILCLLVGFQMKADAVVVDSYITPVPNYFATGAIINVGTPYYPYYCDPYYPYYCRNTYYSTGVYVSPYVNVNFLWGTKRPHHIYPYHHAPRPISYHHAAPAHPHHSTKIAPSNHGRTPSVAPNRPSAGTHSHGSHGKKK